MLDYARGGCRFWLETYVKQALQFSLNGYLDGI